MHKSIQLPELQKCPTQFWKQSVYSKFNYYSIIEEYSKLFATNVVDRLSSCGEVTFTVVQGIFTVGRQQQSLI